METRATIIVEGTVQQVGYRDMVFEQATRMGLKGWVKNRADGSVEIVCEGAKVAVEQFAKDIWIKDFPISVEKLNMSYGGSTGEFRQFRIVQGDADEDTNERLALAARYLRQLGGKVDSVGGKVENLNKVTVDGFSGLGSKVDNLTKITEGVGSKVDNLTNITVQSFANLGQRVDGVGAKVDNLANITIDGFSGLGAKVENLTTTTVQSFARMDMKYDKISKAMVDIVGEMREDRKLANEDRKLVREDMKQSRVEMKQLIQAVLATKK